MTHNGSFSQKYYKSGWGGGSRGNIKSVKFGGAVSEFATPLGLAFSGYNLYGTYKEDGNQWGNNCKKTSCSEAGSWAGAADEAALGSICGHPVTVIGGIINGIFGGNGGGKGGETMKKNI